jgi:hypothetical protein
VYEKPREFISALLSRDSERGTGASISIENSRKVLDDPAINKLNALLDNMMRRATNMSILYDFKITTDNWDVGDVL